jgi:PPOX class probable F420-dependent enzyme
VSLPPEALRFIDRALTVRLCTLSPGGVPMVTPLWFARDGGGIYLGTRAGSFQARHINANPRVVLLFADRGGRRTRRVLRVSGAARVCGPEHMTRRRTARMAQRYYLRPAAALHWLRNWRRLRWMRRYHEERTDPGVIEVELEAAEFLDQPVAG